MKYKNIIKTKLNLKSKGVYSRNNLPKIKDRVYIINLDEHKSIGTHWTALYVNGDNVKYFFDSFGVKYLSNKIKKFIRNKNMKTNNSIMCV